MGTAGGISRLDSAIADAAAGLSGAEEPIAIVIVSDGEEMGMTPVVAAKQLKADHGDRLCLYTVLIRT